MKKSKIYISGKMTGKEDNGIADFKKAEDGIRKLAPNAIILNPVIFPEGMEYEEYMHLCFAMIDVADHVIMLQDWEDSPGAKREREYAKAKGKSIGYMFVTDSRTSVWL